MNLTDALQLYQHPLFLMRMREYCGFSSGLAPDTGAVSLFSGNTQTVSFTQAISPEKLPELLQSPNEIYRSVQDHNHILLHLDIEWINFDAPESVYTNQESVFHVLQPVVEAILLQFEKLQIYPLVLLTGRGYHFAWKIPLHCKLALEIARLGQMTAVFHAHHHTPAQKLQNQIFAGTGMLLEFFTANIKHQLGSVQGYPIELTAVESSNTYHTREIISLDISAYGDPLEMRSIRIPFTLYLKHYQLHPDHFPPLQDDPELFFCIPCKNEIPSSSLHDRSHSQHVLRIASDTNCQIPTCLSGTKNLFHAYRNSPLAQHHRNFYQFPFASSALLSHVKQAPVPACVHQLLEHPNDALLKPGSMRLMTRALLALGWHPREVSSLLTHIFEQDHQWGNLWEGYSPFSRADFYVRIFYDSLCSGFDQAIDFNCISYQEAAFCPPIPCNYNLADFRDSLLRRIENERLASGPFNRLFL